MTTVWTYLQQNHSPALFPSGFCSDKWNNRHMQAMVNNNKVSSENRSKK